MFRGQVSRLGCVHFCSVVCSCCEQSHLLANNGKIFLANVANNANSIGMAKIKESKPKRGGRAVERKSVVKVTLPLKPGSALAERFNAVMKRLDLDGAEIVRQGVVKALNEAEETGAIRFVPLSNA